MSTPSASYLRRSLFWLVATTAVYLLMNGAQLFETALIVPRGPPRLRRPWVCSRASIGSTSRRSGSSFTLFTRSRSSWRWFSAGS